VTNHDYLWLRDPRTRRGFFRVAGLTTVGGGAVFLAACGGDEGEKEAPAERAGGRGDVKILNQALDLEHTAIAAYTAGAALLKGEVLAVGKQFLEQEQEHADGLSSAITDLGDTPNRAKSADEYKQELGLGKLQSQEDVLKFAVDLENTAVAAYIDALPKLSDHKLRQTAAAIVTNEAEHLSVLVGALTNNDPAKQVPDAFVTGKKS
jgi:rubrerythrin